LQVVTSQVEAWFQIKLGLFSGVKDSQDNGNIIEKKQQRMPNYIGKYVAYFLCYQKQNSINCPLKENLEALEEV
jgi:hypothetical protein